MTLTSSKVHLSRLFGFPGFATADPARFFKDQGSKAFQVLE